MISNKQDNRNIISLEDLKEEKTEKKEENEVSEEKNEPKTRSPYLSDDEIKSYLERYRGRIPSVILRDIYEMLKGRRVTEAQIDRIVERVELVLNSDNQLRKIDDIYRKLESLERLLKHDVSGVSQNVAEKAESSEERVERSVEGEKIEAEDISAEKPVEIPEIKSEERVEVKSEVRPEIESSSEFVGGGVMRSIPSEVHVHPKAYAEVERSRSSPRYPARRDRRERYEYCEDMYEYELPSEEPRLTRIPGDAKSIMLLLKWIEFLMEKVGYEGLEDVLNYYVDIYWISEDVLMCVLRYAKGIKLYHENSDWRPVGYMNVQDHLMSLLYIEALRTGRFNRNLIMEVEKDLYRMKKEVAELHGI